jgi:hypothetical protein
MKTLTNFSAKIMWLVCLISLTCSVTVQSTEKAGSHSPDEETKGFVQIKGRITDSATGTALIFANIGIEGTSISTVTNTEGDFSLKIPEELTGKSLRFSFLGYRDKLIPVSELKQDKNKITLDVMAVSLTEINVFPTDPHLLIRAIIKRKKDNYSDSPEIMTAFYREIIKNRRSYASLSEAVIEVYKQSYLNDREDLVRMLKGRKSDDYTKMDTLAFKLMGGPLATLSLDIAKNPYLIVDEEVMYKYNYRIVTVTRSNDRLVYVLEFEQKKEIDEPLFSGRLYIDTESLAIISAAYQINTSNKTEVSKLFIRKKPMGADVYPTSATYIVNYVPRNGKWVFNYSRGDVTFKVNWKKRWFNSVYNTSIELAATNWRSEEIDKPFKPSDRLKLSVIMNEAVAGFADTDFWGAYNVIEPEKSIEQAIKKIKKNLDELNKM